MTNRPGRRIHPRFSPSRTARIAGRSRCLSFTLIELLVVTAILGLVITAIGACISAGLRVWDTAQRVSNQQAAGMLAFALLDRDLGNTFPFYGISFRGGQKELAFPCTLQETPRNPSGIGEVRYAWDSLRRRLLREEKAFAGMHAARPEAETILPDVTDFVVEYGHMPKSGSGEFEWQSQWSDTTNHPHAVRITLGLGGDTRTVRFDKTVWLSLGGEPYGGR